MCFEEFLDFLEHKVDLLEDLEIEIYQIFRRDLAFLELNEIITLYGRLVKLEYFSEVTGEVGHVMRELELESLI